MKLFPVSITIPFFLDGPMKLEGSNDRRSSVFSRDEKMIRGAMTKQSRSKYRPHYGAKEAAKYAARARDGRGL